MTTASEIEEQAAIWLARRDADDAGDNSEFASWLARDPRHRAAYLRLAAAWERTARLKTLRPEGGSVDPDLLAHSRAPSYWAPWRQPLAIAAGVVLAVVALTWLALDSRGIQTYRTEVGGLSRVVLKDGSAITLNTDTELRVKLGETRREVKLVHGEAQFAVAHDTSRPFEVSAGGNLVRAVGTAFDVRYDPSETLNVMVTEGRVAFVDRSSNTPASGVQSVPALISAGEAASATGGTVTVRSVSASESSRRLAWQTGELSFQGETLSQVVTEFNRYNRRKLKIVDGTIESLEIGGNFQALDVDSFIAALEKSFDLTVQAADDGTLLVARAHVATSN